MHCYKRRNKEFNILIVLFNCTHSFTASSYGVGGLIQLFITILHKNRGCMIEVDCMYYKALGGTISEQLGGHWSRNKE